MAPRSAASLRVKLYGSLVSPYVRKVRAVAVELGSELEFEPADAHAIPSDYVRINPVNRIPALRLDDGSLMWDSRVICEYLDSIRGCQLLPASGAAHWHVLKLQVLGDGILDAAVPRYGETLRPAIQQSSSRLAKYQRSIRQVLDLLETQVGDLEVVNLGTLAIACGLGYLDFRFDNDAWRGGRPALAAWYESFAARPSLASTAPAVQVT
jgi:glutathione S-transferase